MFELIDSIDEAPTVKVIGIGSGGENIISRLLESGLLEISYLYVDTDRKAISQSNLVEKGIDTLHIGGRLTQGYDALSDTEFGRQAALDDSDKIREALTGVDVVVITAGMGGGTGTGSSTVIGEVARELKILTAAVVSRPEALEGEIRTQKIDKSIEDLRASVDSLFVIPGEKLILTGKSLFEPDEIINSTEKVVADSIKGIVSLLISPGVINVDLSDISTVLKLSGGSAIGIGRASGLHRAVLAVENALTSEFIDESDLVSAKGLLVNVTGTNLTLGEFEDIGAVVSSHASDQSIVVMGTSIDPNLTDEIKVMVLCAGIDRGSVLTESGATDYHAHMDDLSDVGLSVEDVREDTIKIYADVDTPDEELAELILHLSNVYKSIGGDELIVNSVKDVPPNSRSSSSKRVLGRKRAAR